MNKPERRQDAGALAGAIVNIEVLKTKFENLDDKVGDVAVSIEKGFKNAEEQIWSIKNDIVQRLKDHDKKDDDREQANDKTRVKVESIENRLSNVKYYLAIAVFFYIVGSKGLDAAISHFLAN